MAYEAIRACIHDMVTSLLSQPVRPKTPQVNASPPGEQKSACCQCHQYPFQCGVKVPKLHLRVVVAVARSVSHLLRALDTFKAQGIDFVSFSEQMDTSTPAGKMVFTVLGAVAELERSLIVERVKAGLRNAKAKGKRLGRPKTVLDVKRITALRAQGFGWKRIATDLGVGVGTIYRFAGEGSKIRERDY